MQRLGDSGVDQALVIDDVTSGILLRPIGSLQVTLGPAYWLVLPERPRMLPAVTAVIDWLKAQPT